MKYPRGFTIVELLVVIVMIGILATVVTFAFGNWRAQAAQTELKNELTSIQGKVKDYRNWKNAYPASLTEIEYEARSGVTITYNATGNTSYCATAVSTVVDAGTWYISNARTLPNNTGC